MTDFFRIVRRRSSLALAVLIAFGAVAWQQWLHVAVLDVHSHGDNATLHFLRDGALALLPAIGAIGVGYLLAERLVRRRPDADTFLLRPSLIAAMFGLALVPSVAFHSAIDGWLGGSGGLGTIEPAPGAGYLLADGLDAASGFAGQLVHGIRDSALAVPVAFGISLVALGLAQWWSLTTAGTGSEPAPTVALAGPSLTKRELLKYSGAGAAALALSSSGLTVLSVKRAHAAEPAVAVPWLSDDIELVMNDGMAEMIDRTPVYMYGYGFRSGGVDERDGLNTPGPVLWTDAGEEIVITVTNNLDQDHSFWIEGVVDSGPIAPGESRVVSFPAPGPGTYLYQDGINRPVNRVLGLHGVLIVMPADRSLRLHDDLDPSHWTFDTQWVWLFNEIDPVFNARAQANRSIDPAAFLAEFKPRYFTLNGRTGSLASHQETAPDTVVHDQVGNPALIRMVNAGLVMHGPHIHGNHCYTLMRDGRLQSVIMWKDTWQVLPEGRTDIFLPFAIPPNAVHFPPPESGQRFLEELHGHPMEGSWPMHCHVEMSQTAAGGLYPQGAVTDWKVEL